MTNTITGQDHTMRRGDSRRFKFNVKYTDGRSLTGTTWRYEARKTRTTATAIITKTTAGSGEIVFDADAGTVIVVILPGDTSTIAASDLPGKYIHELEGTDTLSNVDTFAEGVLTIVTDVAHT